mmetsp:Transcript_10830/g.19593  ORF Transcript_10830/g.19593 Transcript_10830/m.19593 type:complete len:321 (-) Transcript_10830:499-1461(-)
METIKVMKENDAVGIALVCLAGVGVVSLLFAISSVLKFAWQYFLRPASSFNKFKGEWAVVTGASAGIGAGFVRSLAKRGVNVVLLARTESKMKDLAAKCTSYGVETKVIPFDFGSASDSDYVKLSQDLSGLTISILVNNVGVNVDFPTDFVDMESALMDQIVKVNISSTNRMTKMLLPGMITRKKGAIFMLSSAGGVFSPAPMLSVYSGTKTYMDALAVAMSGEVSRYGITVQSLAPFFVQTEMSKIRKTSLTVPSADSFAEKSLDALGQEVRLCPHWPHRVMTIALNLLPLKSQVSYVNDLHNGFRIRALKKLEREKAA